MEGIYNEVYSGSNSILTQYRDLFKNQVTTQGSGVMDTHLAKVLKVYQKHLSFWKETDQRRRLKQTAEKMPEKKESDEKVVMKTPKTIPENKGICLFTLLPVKSSFTMSNILIDKTAVQDLILFDKGRNIGEAHAGLFKTVRKLFKEDPMSVLKPFFDIEWFETRTKKFVHFLTNGVSVSVLLGEESEPKPRAQKPKRKRGEEDELPALSSLSYETRVGLDPGLRCLFVAKNNANSEDKKLLAKMSSKEYYHECKFNWNKSKQKKCYSRCQWWKEMINGNITSKAWKNIYKKHSWWKEQMVKKVMTPKTHLMDELKKYAVYALSYLDKALELHYKNPFRKWSFKKYIYKQKTFEKILQRITTKKVTEG